MWEPKSGKLALSLAVGLAIDGEVHRAAIVREFGGEEEDILAAQGPLTPRVTQIIANCLEKLGTLEGSALRAQVPNLTASDRTKLMFAIRSATYGANYVFKSKCPNCGHDWTGKVNLGSFEQTLPEDPLQREFVLTLDNGTEVRWHMMTAKDEQWLEIQPASVKKNGVLTLAMLARVDQVGDTVLNRHQKGSIAVLKKLSARHRTQIRSDFKRREPQMDTDIEHGCPNCGHEYKNTLELGADFFFPQET